MPEYIRHLEVWRLAACKSNSTSHHLHADDNTSRSSGMLRLALWGMFVAALLRCVPADCCAGAASDELANRWQIAANSNLAVKRPGADPLLYTSGRSR